MATGDICGNVERLHRELRQIRYQEDVDEVGLRMGDPVHFLPILHHVLLDYSRYVAMDISAKGYVLQGKTDQRFVECSFKVFREVFKLKPVLTPSQFLDQGYAERKVLLLYDVVQACKAKHEDLLRSAKANVAKPKKKNVTQRPQNAKPPLKKDSIEMVSPTEVLRTIQHKQAKKRVHLDAQQSKASLQASKQQAFDLPVSVGQVLRSNSAGSSHQEPMASPTDSYGHPSPSHSNTEMEGSMALHPRHSRVSDPRGPFLGDVKNGTNTMMPGASVQTTSHAAAFMGHVDDQSLDGSEQQMRADGWQNDGWSGGTVLHHTESMEVNDSATYRDVHEDDEEVPVARDWAQIRAMCKPHLAASRGLVGVPPPMDIAAEAFARRGMVGQTLEGSFRGAPNQEMNGLKSMQNGEIMDIVREMAVRLSKVESELMDTRKELYDTKDELADSKQEVLDTKQELMEATEEHAELKAEVSHIKDTLNASVTIMEGRIKFLEAMLKSQTNQNAKQEQSWANQPTKQPQGNPTLQPKFNIPLAKRNSNPGQAAMKLGADGESRHCGAGHSVSSTSCSPASNVHEDVELSEVMERAAPIESSKPSLVLDKFQSTYAPDNLAQPMEALKCGIDDWAGGSPKTNPVLNSRGEIESPVHDLSGISDTAQLIAVLSKRNQEAQQFLRSFKKGGQ